MSTFAAAAKTTPGPCTEIPNPEQLTANTLPSDLPKGIQYVRVIDVSAYHPSKHPGQPTCIPFINATSFGQRYSLVADARMEKAVFDRAVSILRQKRDPSGKWLVLKLEEPISPKIRDAMKLEVSKLLKVQFAGTVSLLPEVPKINKPPAKKPESLRLRR